MGDFPLNNSLAEFLVLSSSPGDLNNVSLVEDVGAGNLTKEVTRSLIRPSYYIIVIALSYLFGCVGNLIALIYLWNRKNVRNTKHSLMLK